jgi:hypothetical protein
MREKISAPVVGATAICFFALITGCADRQLLMRAALETRLDVFRAVPAEETPELGTTFLSIYCSLKTHKPGYYPFGSSKKGTADFKLLVNIDGQTIQLDGSPREEDSRRGNGPEAGDGMRYTFTKIMLIQPGKHHIIIASPEDDLALEKDINLAQGTGNYLQLRPQYRTVQYKRRSMINGTETSFYRGMKGFELLLNNSGYAKNPQETL